MGLQPWSGELQASPRSKSLKICVYMPELHVSSSLLGDIMVPSIE